MHLIAFGSILALLTAHPPMPAARPAPVPVVHPAVFSTGSPPPVNQSNSVNVFAEFTVTPYCVLNAPTSSNLNFGSTPGNTPINTLFTSNTSLNYFCDLGSGGGNNGVTRGGPTFSIYDATQSGNVEYTLTGSNRGQLINYQLCPSADFGTSGSCSAPYINSSNPSTASPLSVSGTVIPITGWFTTQTTPLIVDFYTDTLTAVIYF